MTDSSEPVGQVSPEEAVIAVHDGAQLLDVRETDEWVAGHAPAAVHLPLGQLLAGADVPAGRLVLVCRSGNRSGRAAEALAGRGLDVVNLAGGMQAWQAAGLAVVRADGRGGDVA